MEDELREILQEFAAETREALVEVEQALVDLEDNPSNSDQIRVVFRAVHTVKGTCGFFGFENLEKVTHEGENLLTQVRDGSIPYSPVVATILLELVDIIRKFIDVIEATGAEAGVAVGDLPARLAAIRSGQVPSKPISAAAPPPPEEEPDELAPPKAQPKATLEPSREVKVPQKVEVAKEPARVEPPKTDAPRPVEAKAEHEEAEGKEDAKAASDGFVRVSTSLLDQLVTLVGELVLTRNQIVQHAAAHPDPVLTPAGQRLDLIASELQGEVMKTRMQPLGTVFNRFPRLVRDVARVCEKEVKLLVDGGQTELDRTLIEAIKDPLVHILRNSVDHGIETPAGREAAGKPREGHVVVRAHHKGGFVHIDISDDGRGIDTARLREKAVSMGVLSTERANELSEREALRLVFHAGLSTAAKVTNVSGRGVGMDVVRSRIEAIGGTVELESTLGMGSTVRLAIPLTLAIVPALMVRSHDCDYAIPQTNLVELLSIDAKREPLRVIAGRRYHRLRDRLLPLVYLHNVLYPDAAEPAIDANHLVVVLQAGDFDFGLVVDEIRDNQEIVVKPMDRLLRGLTVFAGTLITSDGRAALILDAAGIATKDGLETGTTKELLADRSGASMDGGQALLLFASPSDGRMALPLSSVARLEQFPKDDIQEVAGRTVVEYRGSIMPIFNINDLLPERRRQNRGSVDPRCDIDRRDKLDVVVHACGDRRMGILVGCILDTIQTYASTRGESSREGVLYTFVEQGRVTEMIDLARLVVRVEPDFYAAGGAA